MGAYTDRLHRRFRAKRIADNPPPRNPNVECLVSAAIRRDGLTYAGHRTHADIRHALGNTPSYEHVPGDIEGFLTSENRFVDRNEAVRIGQQAGQVPPNFGRELLSSDVKW